MGKFEGFWKRGKKENEPDAISKKELFKAAEWCLKGDSQSIFGHPDEAVKCYDKALEIDPKNAGAWNSKGNSFVKLGRSDEAIRCYDKALEIDPQSIGVWNNKGTYLRMLLRFDEAIKCHDKALEIDPKNADAWLNKGLAEDKLGLGRDATISYRKYVELAPARDAEKVEKTRQRLRQLEGR